jgi:plasmid maintenance system antidote protein VapI
LHHEQTRDRLLTMKPMSFSDEIRDAIRRSGRTGYDISKHMNIAPSTLHRFVHGQTGLSIKSLDKLAEVLDLHVRVGRNPKGD